MSELKEQEQIDQQVRVLAAAELEPKRQAHRLDAAPGGV